MDAAARRHTQGWSREMMSYVALQPIACVPPSIALSCAPLVPLFWRRLMISSIGPVVFVFAFAFVLQRFISLSGIRILCLLTLFLFDLVSSGHPIQALAFGISFRQTIRPLPGVVGGLVALAVGGCLFAIRFVTRIRILIPWCGHPPPWSSTSYDPSSTEPPNHNRRQSILRLARTV